MAKGRKNKNKTQNQQSDDDFPDIMKQNFTEPEPQKKQNKRPPKGAVRVAVNGNGDNETVPLNSTKKKKGKKQKQKEIKKDSDDEDILAKMAKDMELSDTDSTDLPKPKAAQKPKFIPIDSENSSSDKEIQQPKSKFALLQDDLQSEDDKPKSKSKKKRNKSKDNDKKLKTKPVKKTNKLTMLEHYSDSEESVKSINLEVEAKPEPKKKTKKKSKNKSKALEALFDDDKIDESIIDNKVETKKTKNPKISAIDKAINSQTNSTKEDKLPEIIEQKFTHEDEPVQEDPNAFKELNDEELSNLSKKDRRKYFKNLEYHKMLQETSKYDKVAVGTGSLMHFTASQPLTDAKASQMDLSKDIKIENFSISAKGKELYKNADLKVSHGRKYGLIGPNGKGKTSLLRCMAAGLLKIPKHIDLLYCEQEVQADSTSAINSVLNADIKRKDLLDKEKKLLKQQESGIEIDQNELKQVYDEMRVHGVDSAPGRARKILAGLGFTISMQERATQDFSGGWRMRVSLARALFLEPTLLMLDEPTNHLDLNAVIWLNNYLVNWKKTLLIVSHDQQFLDDICTDIIHLDDLKLRYYRCNYSSWKLQYKADLEKRMKDYEKQEKKIREMKKAGQSKKKAESKVKNEALTKKQMKNRDKQASVQASADNQVELISRPKEYVVDFTFPNPPYLNPPVLGLYDVSFAYPKQPPLFTNLDIGVDMDSRISIVGPNGCGKSTLLKLLLKELEPTDGECRRNHRLRTAYYSQHSAEFLPLESSPVEYLTNKFDEVKLQYSRKLLGHCGLAGHAHTIPIKDLSGGQKARVALADLICSHPDIIILDEPTNNLDIESIDALGDAINEFKGGVVIVSHDARLITATECVLYVVENQGMRKIDGDFEDYKDEVMSQLEDMLENNG